MSRNPERESHVFKTIADHLSSGYALTVKDIQEIYTMHGYKPNNAMGFTSARGSAKFTEITGVAVRKDRIVTSRRGNNPVVFTDNALDPTETDLEDVKWSIRSGEAKPDMAVKDDSNPKALTPEQLAEISELHDIAFRNGLNYMAQVVPGKMPQVIMWPRSSTPPRS